MQTIFHSPASCEEMRNFMETNKKVSREHLQADDIVAMIDRFMAGNGGHMNISVNEDGTPVLEREIKTTRSLECSNGQMACQVPTLHQGLDTDEEQ